MRKRKVLLSIVLVLTLVINLVSWGSIRPALATEDEHVTEVTTEQITTETTEEETTVSADMIMPDIPTEVSTEQNETSSEVTTEVSTEVENTTEEVTKSTTEIVTEEDSTEITEEEVNTENNTEPIEEKDSEEIELVDSVEGRDAVTITVTNPYGTYKWDSHYIWLVNGKYAWCLDQGQYMTQGSYTATLTNKTYGSKLRSIRINNAIRYYKYVTGSLTKFNYDAYVVAQQLIWGWTSDDAKSTLSKLNAYAEHNNRLLTGSSTVGALKRVSKANADDGKGSLKSYKKGAKAKTFEPSVAAWKYFANDGSFSTSSAGTHGGISFYKAKVEGSSRKLKVSASVNKDGKISISTKLDGKETSLLKGESVKVYFKVSGDLMGGYTASYYLTKDGVQNLSEEEETAAMYFGVKLTGEGGGNQFYPSIQVNKVDPFGTATDATFGLMYTTWGSPTTPQSYTDLGVSFSANEIFELEETMGDAHILAGNTNGTGHYYVYEKSADGLYTSTYVDGAVTSADALLHFMIASVTGSDGNVYYYLYNADDGTNKSVAAPWTVTATYGDSKFAAGTKLAGTGKTASATITNYIPYGGYSFTKKAEKLVSYEKTADGTIKFKYEQQPTSDPVFKLYAASTITVQDKPVWTANQEIASGTNWCASQSGCVVSYTGKPDANGTVSVSGLPAGEYYFKEVSAGDKYLLNDTPIMFSLEPVLATNAEGEEYVASLTCKASDSTTFVNKPLDASVTVTKLELDKTGESTQPLAGAEFTLYAKSTNKDFNGKTLFTEDIAGEAVISRDNKVGTEVKEAGWVKIESVISGADGKANFGNIPYGDYLVVETRPPKGYSLPNESWKFIHSLANGASSYEFSNSIDYSHTFAFKNEPKYNKIKVYKHGETVVSSEDATNEYGTYKKLKTDDVSLEGVNFAVFNNDDEIVDTFTTNAEGLAESCDLLAGVYWVQEVSTDPQHKLSPERIKVEFTGENENVTVEFKELDFTNELINTSLALYKNGEVPYVTNEVLSHPEQYASVAVTDENSAYTFNVEPLQGAVFAIYAQDDLKNYKDEVVIKAGDCVGYAASNETGVATLKEQILPGNYYYKEIVAPENYRLDGNSYNFTVTAAGADIDMHVNPVSPLVNTHTKSAIKLIKQDNDTEEPLEGVEFELYNSDDVLLGTYYTDENGEIYVGDVPLGSYYFIETEPLEGYYEYTDKITYEITNDGMEYTIIAYNEVIPDEPEVPKKPKLGTVESLDIFCSILMLFCIGGLFVIWIPRRKED